MLIKRILITFVIAVVGVSIFGNISNINTASAQEDIVHTYNVIEVYDTSFSHVVDISLLYSKYSTYPNYVVNVRSTKKDIYPKASTQIKRSDRISYGEKLPVYHPLTRSGHYQANDQSVCLQDRSMPHRLHH